MSILTERRSVRQFTNADISDEQLKYILRAAMYAPSAMNRQPWQYYVTKRGDKLTQLAELWNTAFLPKPTNAEEEAFIKSRHVILQQAAAVVLVCGDSEKELTESWATVDCGAATQNLLLATHELGLGGVWIGVWPRLDRAKLLADFFKLPPHHKAFALCALGVPAVTPVQPAERYDASKVHFV